MLDPHQALLSICSALAAGTILIALSRRLKLPTIVFLLAGGVLLGPEFANIIQPQSLGPILPLIVSLAVGIILFEGGLTLDLHGFLQASGVIQRLLTIGVLITWLGTATAIWAIFSFSIPFSLLAGSLVIVTGPTVILPILKRINAQPRIHHILHWEGVLIDAIGVFIALLCFEWMVAGEGVWSLAHFGTRVGVGLAYGILGGWAMYLLIHWRIIPESVTNAFTLAGAVMIFGLTEAVIEEGGLLAVTVAGLIIGWKHPAELKQIRQFKAEITDLMIGLLFLLLASRLRIDQFRAFGEEGLMVIAVLIFLIRPLSVMICTQGSGLPWREKLFLSWIAPRGIVAASMTSLFALELSQKEHQGFDPAFLETFVYSTIVATVVIQGFSAGLVARILRVSRPKPDGWLIIGANVFARRVARFIRDQTGLPVVLVDRNETLVSEARHRGLEALADDALNPELFGLHPELQRTGHVLALTDNSDLNSLICSRWSEQLGRSKVFCWRSVLDRQGDEISQQFNVWQQLPRPTELSAELVREDSELVVFPPDTKPEGRSIPLLTARKGKVHLSSLFPGWDDWDKGHTLAFKRHGGFFVRSLEHSSLLNLVPEHPPLPFTEMLEAAAKLYPDLPVDQLSAELTSREVVIPSYIGHGVAVPHLYVAGLKQRLCIVARRQEPDTDEDVPRLVFLLLSAPTDPEGHLATLAEIARACSREEVRQSIIDAPDLDSVLQILRKRPDKG